MIFPCAKSTNTMKYKYTNTPIKLMTKCQKDPICGIFLKRGLFKDIKNDFPRSQTRKYKNANTRIHKYNIWQSTRKTQHVVYFWKEDCSSISNMIFPCVKSANTKIQIQKYTNTQIQHITKCQKDPPNNGIHFFQLT